MYISHTTYHEHGHYISVVVQMDFYKTIVCFSYCTFATSRKTMYLCYLICKRQCDYIIQTVYNRTHQTGTTSDMIMVSV